jgi:hypothetical protein
MRGVWHLVNEPLIRPRVLFPGRVPVNGQPHILEVAEEDMSILHIHSCLNCYGEVACDVDYAENWGYGSWHHAEISLSSERLTDGLIPGHYWIQFWSEGSGEDTEVGLELMYPEEDRRVDR